MPDARALADPISYQDLRDRLENGKLGAQDSGSQSLLIVLGTGWGIAPRFFEKVDAIIQPLGSIREASYNHLSVRAAAAIVLDRLFGKV
jgi:hypothetical protein